ncbi:MAG: hypothetical protein ACPK7O_10150 [Methanobacterium sp.]
MAEREPEKRKVVIEVEETESSRGTSERQFEGREQQREGYGEEGKTGEVWTEEDKVTTSSDVEKEYEKGKTPRVDSDLQGSERVIVNPPDSGGKILKDAVGARGHNPGYGTSEGVNRSEVERAAEDIERGEQKTSMREPERRPGERRQER